ncbi:hypothetical protein HAHE_22250 [Haloferula helveola]|uniref:SGNH hydrolase-type esterase domain-containing protein n=1 Tax=Haloferula helveola TaxID=490095 RepID=A0ABM7RKS1_9BACT|nr:hypothetical protein HAHE_22250 [Haloferula helveola]
MRYAVTWALGLVLCFTVQGVALRLVGGRTIKSESNYFSSLGRIQAGVRGEPRVMMLGSSITGRLPDRAQGFNGLANLGCDGGSAADTLRAIDQGLLPAAPVLLVEANSLHLAMPGGTSEVGQAIHRPWFRVGVEVPAVSSYARPAAFAYSRLLATRTGGFGDAHRDDLGLGSAPSTPAWRWDISEIDALARRYSDELVDVIRRVEQAGSRVIVVLLPPARMEGGEPPPWLRRTISESGAEWWDLGTDVDPGLVQLTDGVHMDGGTAVRTVNSIRSGLNLPDPTANVLQR